MLEGGKKDRLATLRQQLVALENGGREASLLPFGAIAMDRSLPGGGLPLGALHELCGAKAEVEDGASAVAFLASILTRLSPGQPVLWCFKRADLYAPGLALYGLASERLILAHADNDQEVLWTMEEGLRCRAVAAVVGELAGVPLTASRRLQLAAEMSGVTGFALSRQNLATTASAAVTRWRIGARPGALKSGEPGIGQTRWHVELLRCRGGVPAAWYVEAKGAADLVAVSAALADRSTPRPQRAVG